MKVEQLAEVRRRGEDIVLLDVREPEEVTIASIPGAVNIPMSQIESRVGEIDSSKRIVVMCHHGVRSARVASYLRQLGFAHVENLEGGIDAWSCRVDPSTPRY